MRESFLACLVLWVASACVRDPLYCDTDEGCGPGRRCALPAHECVEAPDLFVPGPDLARDLSEPPLPLLGYGQLLRGRTALSCPAGATASRLGTIYSGIDDTRRSCACECQWSCQFTLGRYQFSSCATFLGSQDLTAQALQACVPVGSAAGIIASSPRLTCTGSGTGAVEPGYQSAGVLCLPPGTGEDCTTADCINRRLANACIALQRAPCPAPFTRADTWYRSYSETRPPCACSGCRPDGSCRIDAQVNSTSACTGTNLSTILPNTCTQVTPNQHGLRYAASLQFGKGCEASYPLPPPASPAQLGNPVVLCCLPN